MKYRRATAAVTGLFTAALVGSLAACSPGGGEESNELTLYTSSPSDIYEAAVAEFQAETGIQVDVVSAGTGELTNRILAEGERPLGDVMWGGRAGALAPIMDHLAVYVSPNDSAVHSDYQNAGTSEKLTPYSIQVNAMLVNNELAGDIEIDGFESLLQPELKGQIAFADPTRSSSAFEAFLNMLISMGDGDPEDGWDYAEEFIENLDGVLQGSSSNAHVTVADGEYIVGVTPETTAMPYISSGADVSLVYPSEGVVIKPDYIGIIENANNRENAEKFVDFVTSKEHQETIEEFGRRTVRTDVTLNVLAPLEDIPAREDVPEWVEENSDRVRDTFSDIFVETN